MAANDGFKKKKKISSKQLSLRLVYLLVFLYGSQTIELITCHFHIRKPGASNALLHLAAGYRHKMGFVSLPLKSVKKEKLKRKDVTGQTKTIHSGPKRCDFRIAAIRNS